MTKRCPKCSSVFVNESVCPKGIGFWHPFVKHVNQHRPVCRMNRKHYHWWCIDCHHYFTTFHPLKDTWYSKCSDDGTH